MTFQERLIFDDQDLRKPEHDNIIKWVCDSACTDLSQWLGVDAYLSAHAFDAICAEAERQRSESIFSLRKVAADLIPSTPANETGLARALSEVAAGQHARREVVLAAIGQLEALSIVAPTRVPTVKVTGTPAWEVPITRKRPRGDPEIVGYADAVISYDRFEPGFDIRVLDEEWSPNNWWRNGAPPRFRSPDFVIRRPSKAFFEAKTVIPSVGELLRQLNYYRTFWPGDWFVVSPDSRFKGTIIEQGYRFIEYRPG